MTFRAASLGLTQGTHVARKVIPTLTDTIEGKAHPATRELVLFISNRISECLVDFAVDQFS